MPAPLRTPSDTLHTPSHCAANPLIFHVSHTVFQHYGQGVQAIDSAYFRLVLTHTLSLKREVEAARERRPLKRRSTWQCPLNFTSTNKS